MTSACDNEATAVLVDECSDDKPSTASGVLDGTSSVDCVICQGPEGDGMLDRVEVWRDELWRLTMARHGPTLAFAFLEPRRHIPYISDLDGPEAKSFGAAIARACRALKDATEAKLVYAYVFGGGIPHLHVHLAPNRPDGVLSSSMIGGRLEEHKLPSGATEIRSLDHPNLPDETLTTIIARVRAQMTAGR